MVQQVKDPVLSLLCCVFYPWPGNICMPQALPKKKKKKKGKKGKKFFFKEKYKFWDLMQYLKRTYTKNYSLLI